MYDITELNTGVLSMSWMTFSIEDGVRSFIEDDEEGTWCRGRSWPT
jgi:hypothetical protein